MNQNDYQKWAKVIRQWQFERERNEQKVRYIRVSNDRYANEAALADRLTDDDRFLLQEMGMAL